MERCYSAIVNRAEVPSKLPRNESFGYKTLDFMAKVDERNSETLVRGVLPWVLQANLVGCAVLGTQGLQDFKGYM